LIGIFIAIIISIWYNGITESKFNKIECKLTFEERDKLGGLSGNRMLNYKNYLIKKYTEE
jgi:hypothetical protein